MNNLEDSCREASEYFKNLGETARNHKNRERMYRLSLDTLCSAVWIEHMRKLEFFMAQQYPEEYKICMRMMLEDEIDQMKEEEDET